MKNNEHYPGKLQKIHKTLKRLRIHYKILFVLMGIISTVWFLARVIPKPSRIGYPCVQAAAPVMSGFLVYLAGLLSTVALFRGVKRNLARTRYITAAILLGAGLTVMGLLVAHTDLPLQADVNVPLAIHAPNQVMGTGQGIYPGRVVWAWNADATNENCNPTMEGDGWWLVKNNDQEVVDQMLEDAILKLTGESTLADAWDALFKYHNNKKHGSEDSYTPGEKILLKINVTSAWGAGYSWGNMDENFEKKVNQFYGISETSPQVVLAVLKHLANEVGVPQQDIWVGDPMKNIYQHQYDMLHAAFPDVKYLGNHLHYNYSEQDLTDAGRTPVVEGWDVPVYYSDEQVMSGAVDLLYTVYEEADYMINIPALKAHARAGVTLTAKNHFGSHTRPDAGHLHPGLVDPNGDDGDGIQRPGYQIYRTQVDIMGHPLLGGNTMLCLVDALWAGSEAVDPPTKWDMTPFNGDWTSSLILSQDQVAVESVCFDFLRNEYDGTDGKVNYPNISGVDDYLMQAADPANWPSQLTYAPDGTNTLGSLGVHEHWNSPEDKAYSRNLGLDEGIELVSIPDYLVTSSPALSGPAEGQDHFVSAYPNPFADQLNITFRISSEATVGFEVYNLGGQLLHASAVEPYTPGEHTITWEGRDHSGAALKTGTYLATLKISNASGTILETRQVQKVR